MSDMEDDKDTQQVFDAMLDAVEPVDLRPERAAAMKRRILARVDAAVGAPWPDRQGLITIRAAEGDWQAFMPKVALKVLMRDGDTMTYLMRIEPGGMVPPHDHPQTEECVVLDGEAYIGDLRVKAGDYHAAPAGKPHGLLRSDGGALLFLRGAVPAAKNVRWGDLDAYAPLLPESLRNRIGRWKGPE